jgi:hypothetical protein
MPAKSQKQRPWQSDMLDALAASDLDGTEYRIIQTAVRWADPCTGAVRVSVDTWAYYSRQGRRTVQLGLRELERKRTVVADTDKRGGAGRSVTYRIPMFAVRANGASAAPFVEPERAQDDATNGARGAANGAGDDSKQRTACARRTDTKNLEEHTQESEAVGVLRALGLGDELLRHPNATPERLEYVARETKKATTKNPAGLAKQAIREAWNPPTLAPGGAGGIGAAERARELVEGLEPEARASLLKQVRRDMPNLANLPDDDVSVVGAIAILADPKRRKRGDGSFWYEESKTRNLCDESASGVEGEGPLGLPPF